MDEKEVYQKFLDGDMRAFDSIVLNYKNGLYVSLTGIAVTTINNATYIANIKIWTKVFLNLNFSLTYGYIGIENIIAATIITK